jgi:voltage-gated potassium channel
LSARELNPGLFIAARASTEAAANKLRRAGATLVVSPYVSAGHRITDAILRPKMAKFLSQKRGSSEIELSDLNITAESPFCGKTVCDVGQQFPEVDFVVIKSQGELKASRPRGNRVFAADDTVTIAGKDVELEEIHRAAEREKSPTLE